MLFVEPRQNERCENERNDDGSDDDDPQAHRSRYSSGTLSIGRGAAMSRLKRSVPSAYIHDPSAQSERSRAGVQAPDLMARMRSVASSSARNRAMRCQTPPRFGT